MTTVLRDALRAGGRPDDTTAVVARVNADGTFDLDLGGGQRALSVPAVKPAAQIYSGVPVIIMRYPSGQLVILGERLASNPTTVTHDWGITLPYNVTPGTPGVSSPLVVAAAETRSWRSTDGWSRPDVYQASSSSGLPPWVGCYFYGLNAFSAPRGRPCTSLAIHLSRSGAGGNSGPTPMWVGPHVHPTVPGGQPLFPWGAINVGSLAWSVSGDLTLPTWWGDLLTSGQASGVGHLRMTYGFADYAILKSVAAEPLSGRITLGFS